MCMPAICANAGEDLEDMVEQQLWATSVPADQDGSNDDSSSGRSDISSLAAGAADDKGLAAWELNMKSLKTAAYDLGRLPSEVHAAGSWQQGLHMSITASTID